MSSQAGMITIIDYGTGNLRSIHNMLRHLDVDSEITSDPARVAQAGKLILPGVGKFDYGMRELEARGLAAAMTRRVTEDGAPILGICLGAQLLTHASEEGELPGLGWVAARTVRFDGATVRSANVRVPHMGWADTEFLGEHPLASGLASPRFYYVHSYHLEADAPENVLCRAVHGRPFTAGIAHGHILGVQFHPEKSHHFGMTVLKNFAERY